MYLYPSEEVSIILGQYSCTAQSGSIDLFSDRFYTEIAHTFNEILGKITDPLYEQGFRKYVNSQKKELEDI